MEKADFLVIGSGIAGLTYALKVADYFKSRKDISILILTKASSADESNTRYAQGGIAAVHDFVHDSYEKHIEDTLTAGDGLCNEETVKIVVKEGPERIKEIIEWGAKFDKTPEGDYDLAREGGHSEHRIYHHKDITGAEIVDKLLKRLQQYPNIKILTHYFAIDLITQHHLGIKVTRKSENIECYGAYVFNAETSEVEKILAKVTLLASGGAGQVYENTTNPLIATGDGIAMAYRAKAAIENMEFIQFHPTALYNPGESPSFLITEAMRGFGAELKTKSGQPFMHKYDERKSLAPRDIVARAIDAEMKKRGDSFVYLDCTQLDETKLIDYFPNIYEKCLSLGIDITRQMIPVVPAAHYLCGGIKTGLDGSTSIRHLYASGECTCSGLHGANRLASNSLLEALVFAHGAFHSAVKEVEDINYKQGIPDWSTEGTTEPEELVLINHNLEELKSVMSDYVGIVRSNIRLKRALERLRILYEETEELYKTARISPQLCELRNLINIAYLITTFAMRRKESRGLHYNLDYPQKLPKVINTTLP